MTRDLKQLRLQVKPTTVSICRKISSLPACPTGIHIFLKWLDIKDITVPINKVIQGQSQPSLV